MCWQHSDTYRLWLDSSQMLPVLIDCWVDNMKLSYDNMTRTTRNSPGVKVSVPGWGNVSTMGLVDPTPVVNYVDYGYYFYYIIEALTANGYDRQKNMFGAPYDFRKGPSEYSFPYLHQCQSKLLRPINRRKQGLVPESASTNRRRILEKR